MRCSVDDETFLLSMNMGSICSQAQWSQDAPSEEYEHQDGHKELEFEGEGEGEAEGFVDGPRGRSRNYTMEEYIFVCTTWTHVIMDACSLCAPTK
jgi:hypothetical protein